MKIHKYSNGEITILWQPSLCKHSGICAKTLPDVYHPNQRPWIIPQNASSQAIIEQVAKCPSGALSIQKKDDLKE